MRKRIVFATFLLSTCGVFWGNGFGQEARKPFTKQEILRLLKPTPGTRYEQGDLAGEIAQRGIAFPVDEKTLDELRKAGARSFVIDAIQKAAQNEAQEQTQEQPVNPSEALTKIRNMLELVKMSENDIIAVLKAAQIKEALGAKSLAEIPDAVLTLAIEDFSWVETVAEQLKAKAA